jgi:hypothetical protein
MRCCCSQVSVGCTPAVRGYMLPYGSCAAGGLAESMQTVQQLSRSAGSRHVCPGLPEALCEHRSATQPVEQTQIEAHQSKTSAPNNNLRELQLVQVLGSSGSALSECCSEGHPVEDLVGASLARCVKLLACCRFLNRSSTCLACFVTTTHCLNADAVLKVAPHTAGRAVGYAVAPPMHAATCMRLPSRPWCLPPQLCVRKHTCSSAPQCPPHTVYPRTAAPSGSSVLVKAAAADPDPDVVAYPGVKPQPEPVPTPAAAAAVTPDGAGSSSTADPEPAKPKRVPWNKGRKHLPGMCAGSCAPCCTCPFPWSTSSGPCHCGHQPRHCAVAGTIERIKAGNAAALQRPEVQAKIKAMAEARRGVPTGRKSPQVGCSSAYTAAAWS